MFLGIMVKALCEFPVKNLVMVMTAVYKSFK